MSIDLLEEFEEEDSSEVVFQTLISDLNEAVSSFRLNIFLLISIISTLGFSYSTYRSLFIQYNLIELLLFSYMFLNFLFSSIFCIRSKVKERNFDEKTFTRITYICITPYFILYHLYPFLTSNTLFGLYNFCLSFVPVMIFCLTLGRKKGTIAASIYLFIFIFYIFLHVNFSTTFNNSYEFGAQKATVFFLTNSLIWMLSAFFFIVFSSRTVRKMKEKIPNSLKRIEFIEEQNRKDKEETERLALEVEAIDSLKKALYFDKYKEESLEKFSLDVHFQIGTYRDDTIDFTPYYDCVYFEDQYLFCMGKFTENDIYSMASVLMIQTSLNNSFSKNFEKIDIIEVLDRVNSVLFFNNQMRMELGSFSSFTLVHYNQKKEEISFLSLNQENIFVPKNPESPIINCEYPEEMQRYYLGMFGDIPDIENFQFHTFPFSKGDSLFICDYLDDHADFFAHMSKDKSQFQNKDSKKTVESFFGQELFKPSFLSYIKKV